VIKAWNPFLDCSGITPVWVKHMEFKFPTPQFQLSGSSRGAVMARDAERKAANRPVWWTIRQILAYLKNDLTNKRMVAVRAPHSTPLELSAVLAIAL
jgi:hypothetical protein